MKKNLTTMIAAATALLGMSSCNDSNNNNSKKPLEPIAPAAFAKGLQGYVMTAKGMTCRLQGNYGNADNATAEIPARGGLFILSDAHQDYYCAMSYSLHTQENAATATLTMSFAADDVVKLNEDDAFRSFWQIAEGDEVKETDTYAVNFAFPAGTFELSRNAGGVGGGTFYVVTFEQQAGDDSSAQP